MIIYSLQIANQVMQLVLNVLFTMFLLKSKYSVKITFFAYMIFSLAQYIPVKLSGVNIAWKAPYVLLTDAIFIFFMFQATIIFKFIVLIIKYLVAILVDVFLIGILSAIGINNFSASELSKSPNTILMALILYNLIFASVLTMFFMYIRRISLRITGKKYLLFSLIPINQLILLVGICYYSNYEYEPKFAIFGTIGVLLCILADFATLWLLKNMARMSEESEKVAVLESMREADKEYYELLETYTQQMNQVRHDFRNQIGVAYAMMENAGEEKMDLSQGLLAEMDQNIEEIQAPIYCGNSLINGVIHLKSKLIVESSIRFETDILISESMGIANYDLCSVFANLLDNAIEAAEKVLDENQRWIRIRARIKAGYLVVKVENSKSSDVCVDKGKLVTTKRNKKKHGYGMELLRSIADKYDGDFQYDFDESCFNTMLALRIQTEE